MTYNITNGDDTKLARSTAPQLDSDLVAALDDSATNGTTKAVTLPGKQARGLQAKLRTYVNKSGQGLRSSIEYSGDRDTDDAVFTFKVTTKRVFKSKPVVGSPDSDQVEPVETDVPVAEPAETDVFSELASFSSVS